MNDLILNRNAFEVIFYLLKDHSDIVDTLNTIEEVLNDL